MKKLFLLLIPVAMIILMIACKKKENLPAEATCACSGAYYQYMGGNDTIFAPTVFTPDGDGFNDYFHLLSPRPLTLSGFSMTIYSGASAIYTTTNPNDTGWNGRINGLQAGAGRYVVHLKFTDDNGKTVEDCTCVDILQYDGVNNCYVRPSSTYFYEDQFDPSKGPVVGTLQHFCK